MWWRRCEGTAILAWIARATRNGGARRFSSSTPCSSSACTCSSKLTSPRRLPTCKSLAFSLWGDVSFGARRRFGHRGPRRDVRGRRVHQHVPDGRRAHREHDAAIQAALGPSYKPRASPRRTARTRDGPSSRFAATCRAFTRRRRRRTRRRRRRRRWSRWRTALWPPSASRRC